jgi:hypothetical protein
MIDVLKACERHDADAFVKAIKDPRAARFAFLMLTVEDDEIIAIDFLETGEAKIGRVKKPRLKKTNYVAFGSTLVTVINDIWDEQYGKHQRRRDNPPRASEIAAYYLSEKGTRVSAGQIDAFRRKYGAP